jgi:hypothetical protein
MSSSLRQHRYGVIATSLSLIATSSSPRHLIIVSSLPRPSILPLKEAQLRVLEHKLEAANERNHFQETKLPFFNR